MLRCAVLQSVRVATALNWQMVCGCVAASDPLGGSFDPVRYNSTFAAEFAQVWQQALPLAKAFKVGRRGTRSSCRSVLVNLSTTNQTKQMQPLGVTSDAAPARPPSCPTYTDVVTHTVCV